MKKCHGKIFLGLLSISCVHKVMAMTNSVAKPPKKVSWADQVETNKQVSSLKNFRENSLDAPLSIMDDSAILQNKPQSAYKKNSLDLDLDLSEKQLASVDQMNSLSLQDAKRNLRIDVTENPLNDVQLSDAQILQSILNKQKEPVQAKLLALVELLIKTEDPNIATIILQLNIRQLNIFAAKKLQVLEIIQDRAKTPQQKIDALTKQLHLELKQEGLDESKNYREKLFTDAIAKLKEQIATTKKAPVEQQTKSLQADIATLKKQSNRELRDFLGTGNPVSLGKWLMISLQILSKRGAVTAKSAQSMVMNLFASSKALVPAVTQQEVAQDVANALPAQNSSLAAFNAWIAQSSAKIYDAILQSMKGSKK